MPAPPDLAGPPLTSVTPAEFNEICRLARDSFGLDLKPGKEALVSARLGKRLRALGMNSVKHYLAFLKQGSGTQELISLIDALTTNFSSFLREPAHFEFLRQALRSGWGGRGELRFWSSACASGEEPYSLLMVLADELGDAGLSRVRLLASDISTRVLETAAKGVYPSDRLESLPNGWLQRFFQKGSGRMTGFYRAKPLLRERLECRRLNLMEPFDSVGTFHTVFCRNVMIYFDRPTQEALVSLLAGRIEPGGYFFIGHSEGLMGIKHNLNYVQPAIYRRATSGTGKE